MTMRDGAAERAGWTAARPAGPVRIVWEYVLFYGLLLFFGIVCLAWNLPATALDAVLPRRYGRPLSRFMIRLGFRTYLGAMKACGILKCDLGALDALKDDGGLVICPNHPSLLDAVFVISHLPRTVCIAKANVYDNLFLGSGARMAGYIRNDAATALVKSAAREVRDGHQLLIFPEGTRTVSPPINSLKGGFALIARHAGVPVQTVLIQSNSRFLGKGWNFFRKPEFPLVYTVRLGRRFEPEADVRALVRKVEDHYRTELRS